MHHRKQDSGDGGRERDQQRDATLYEQDRSGAEYIADASLRNACRASDLPYTARRDLGDQFARSECGCGDSCDGDLVGDAEPATGLAILRQDRKGGANQLSNVILDGRNIRHLKIVIYARLKIGDPTIAQTRFAWLVRFTTMSGSAQLLSK